MGRSPKRPTSLALAAVLIAAGCTMVGKAPEEPAPGGTATGEIAPPAQPGAVRAYGGSVTFDGNRIPLVLELAGTGSEYSARLSIPTLDLDAHGGGTMDGERVSMELSYAGTCPGRLRLDGRFREDRRRIEGRLTASDCTGTEEGAVVLLLRPGSRGRGGR